MLSLVRTVPWRRCFAGRPLPILRSTQPASFTTAASASSASHSSTSSSTYQTPSAQLAALVAAESAAAGVKPPRPQPTARYAVKSNRLAEECYHTPTTPKLRTKGEFEQLLKKGHDGEKYDMIACWHLGNIYFDGVVGPSGTTADAATTRASTVASTPTASIPSNDTASSSSTADIASPFTFAPETPIQPEAALLDESPLNLPKNYTQSLLWFTNAAFEGHVPSRTKLGVMYLAGYGIKRNIPIAFELFTESSNFGDRDAMAHLAAMYLQGIGAPTKDVAKAIEWYTKAAERGHVRAQAILAKLLNSPESGSSRNPSLALHWLNESARQGHVESLFLLGERASEESTKFDWYMKAAKLGHAQSQYWVGLSYLTSSPLAVARLASLDDRYIEARRYFSEAVEAGNVHAQARLGFMMWHGIGGKVDKSNGIMWLNNAAEANHVDVQLLLGSIAYDEYVDTHSPNDPIDEEDKKMQTAKHYFGKVLENANRHCTTLPSGSLPLLARMAQNPSLPSKYIRLFQQRTGHPWLGDLNTFLVEIIPASKQNPSI